MQTATKIREGTVSVLAQGEGEYVHALDNLVTFKATAGETGALAAVEFEASRGFGPPLHSHRVEDERVVVLDGVVAFRNGGNEIVATNGACTYFAHGIPHTFQVRPGLRACRA